MRRRLGHIESDSKNSQPSEHATSKSASSTRALMNQFDTWLILSLVCRHMPRFSSLLKRSICVSKECQASVR